jgi:cell division initiation protein
MKPSPSNIKRQEFKTSLRGYDREEVLAFLEKLADDIDELLNENEALQKKLDAANEKLAEYRKLEKSLQDTLSKAQESSARSIESAKKQTNLMIQEAELKAQQILEKAKGNANQVRDAVIHLREEKGILVSKLKAIINSQAHLLEMKVENSVKEVEQPKTVGRSSKVDIDVDDIADKL